MRALLLSFALLLGCGNKSKPPPGPGPGPGSAAECPEAECGPRLGMPSQQCEDGSIGGNTGRCLRNPSGCGWEIRECPPSNPAP